MTRDTVCLIVDDVEFDRLMMRRVLARTCPDVPLVVARTLSEARARLADRNVSILFLDNALPDGMGIDLLAEMKADRALRRIPVVIVSDFPSPFMYAKARAADASEVWSKREFVGEKVRRVVQNARLT